MGLFCSVFVVEERLAIRTIQAIMTGLVMVYGCTIICFIPCALYEEGRAEG